MNKIFLDVGAHTGSTTRIILGGNYSFDSIHCFEPVKRNYEILKNKFKDKKVIIHEFGLLDETCDKLIYCAGSDGGSVFKDKRQPKRKEYPSSEMCKFVKAGDWFNKNLSADDYVIVKINIEGAEIPVLNNLLDTGEYDKINHLLISFDIGKVKGKAYLKDDLVEKLNLLGKKNYITTGDLKLLRKQGVIGNKHVDRIRYWLDSLEGMDNGK